MLFKENLIYYHILKQLNLQKSHINIIFSLPNATLILINLGNGRFNGDLKLFCPNSLTSQEIYYVLCSRLA